MASTSPIWSGGWGSIFVQRFGHAFRCWVKYWHNCQSKSWSNIQATNYCLTVYGCFTYVLFIFMLGCFTNVLEALHVVSLTSCRSFFELQQNLLKILAQEE